MGDDWQLVIHEQAWDFSETLRSTERLRLKKALHSLLSAPNQTPDASRVSPAGRTYSVKYFGRLRVIYWLDSFVREVRIVEIEFVHPDRVGRR